MARINLCFAITSNLALQFGHAYTAAVNHTHRRVSLTRSDCKIKEPRKLNASMIAPNGVGSDYDRKSFNDFAEMSKQLMKMEDGGPPRWLSPLECGIRVDRSPLLLYLPGIVGLGTGLWLQNETLGKIFDIWCLHIPLEDRTSFSGFLQMVEQTIQREYKKSPERPIYIVGESLGACVALAVAARNPHIDLVLLLANPGNPTKLLSNGETPEFPLTKETFQWKIEVIEAASAYANARLHSVNAKTLILASGRDHLFPSTEEAHRIRRIIPNCIVRVYDDIHHQLLLDNRINLVSIIKATGLYKRGHNHDCVHDYIPMTPEESKIECEKFGSLIFCNAPVMLSTLHDGRVVRGIRGLPENGPVLYVGYHMMGGLDVFTMVAYLYIKERLRLRALAHPLFFGRTRDGYLPPLDSCDCVRMSGSVPVTSENLYKLLSSKAHVVLYPGGLREALHRKGEEYVLHWPEHPEFVRMAAKFGAKIVPFGTVGEDDVFEILLDYNDQMKIPMLREFIGRLNEEFKGVRSDKSDEEIGNQRFHYVLGLPKIPGRYYYLFGKPIETKGNEEVMRDKGKAFELYSHVKKEVENCIAFLKEKRESDPYRNILPRIAYQAIHGFSSEIPSFHL